MIGLCQRGKSSPDALRRSVGVSSCSDVSALLASRPGFFAMENQTSIGCLGPASGLEQKIEFVLPASLETYQREHREPALLRPAGLTARPGRQRAEKISLLASPKRPRKSRGLTPGNGFARDPRPPDDWQLCQVLVNAAVSMGRCNTRTKSTCRSFKG